MAERRRRYASLVGIVTLVCAVSQPIMVAAGPRAAARANVNNSGNSRANVNHNVNANQNANVNRNVNVNQNANVNRNVNVNRDVDVNVNHYGGGYGYGCCYHPVATAAAVTATAVATAAVVGSMVNTLPPSCTVVAANGISYQHCGSVWYQPQFSGTSVTYLVVDAPR